MNTIRKTTLLFLLALGSEAHANDSFATQAKLKQCELTMEVAMMVGDKSDEVHLRDARMHLHALDDLLEKANQQHPELSAAIAEDFSDEKKNLEEELFVNGYSASSHLSFVISQRNVTAALATFSGREGASSPVLLAFSVCDVVANYLLITTSPLGPDNVANFNNDESDFPKQLERIDVAFEALSAEQKFNMETLRNTKSQWRFIRAPLMNFNRISTPFIVHRSGKTVINNLLGM